MSCLNLSFDVVFFVCCLFGFTVPCACLIGYWFVYRVWSLLIVILLVGCFGLQFCVRWAQIVLYCEGCFVSWFDTFVDF